MIWNNPGLTCRWAVNKSEEITLSFAFHCQKSTPSRAKDWSFPFAQKRSQEKHHLQIQTRMQMKWTRFLHQFRKSQTSPPSSHSPKFPQMRLNFARWNGSDWACMMRSLVVFIITKGSSLQNPFIRHRLVMRF